MSLRPFPSWLRHPLSGGTHCMWCPPPSSPFNPYSLKYQVITSPCGLIEYLYGPVQGRHHDSWMVVASNLDNQLSEICNPGPGEGRGNFYIYGDPAYKPSPYLLRGNRRQTRLSPEALDVQVRMNRMRVSVEWGFKEVTELFPALSYRRGQRLLLSPLALQYKVAVILMIAITCFRGGNQTSAFFKCRPPSIEEWLRRG